MIDVTGYFLDDLSFSPMSPRRLADTRLTGSEAMVRVDCTSRVGSTLKGPGPLAAGACYRFDVSTPAGLQPGRVGMVALNVTVAQARRDGYLTIWPSTAVRPSTSARGTSLR